MREVGEGVGVVKGNRRSKEGSGVMALPAFSF